ncbi:MAG: hypothetical protein ACKOFC_05185 [Solirubrobacterales bacterium]
MRRTVATWYDQTGSTTACGVDLERNTLGVAHRSLPCGAEIDSLLAGRPLAVEEPAPSLTALTNRLVAYMEAA